MVRYDHVFVDETDTVTYRHRGSLKLIGAGIGTLDFGTNGSALDFYDWVGIAKSCKRICRKEIDVVGMLTADKLIEMSKPDRDAGGRYHVCAEINKYTMPYLVNHEWRGRSNLEKRIGRTIANRTGAVDCRTPYKGNYRRKQKVGDMATAALKEVVIPKRIVDNLVEDPNKMLNLRTLEFVESQAEPPKYYIRW